MLSLVTLVALAIVVTSAIDRMAYARRLKRWRARRSPLRRPGSNADAGTVRRLTRAQSPKSQGREAA